MRPRIEFPDPARPVAPPNEMDMKVHGCDSARHPVTGSIVNQNGGSAEEQALNFLYSLRRATEQGIAGREYDLSEDEYQTMRRKVVKWHETNSVAMPPVVIPLGFERKFPNRR